MIPGDERKLDFITKRKVSAKMKVDEIFIREREAQWPNIGAMGKFKPRNQNSKNMKSSYMFVDQVTKCIHIHVHVLNAHTSDLKTEQLILLRNKCREHPPSKTNTKMRDQLHNFYGK